MTSRADRISAILADECFRETVKGIEAQLTRKVMGAKTSQEDRDEALHQYHALDRLLAAMRAVASEKDDAAT